MHHINLDTITLAHGGHRTRDQGVCLLEAVAWWADEAHTDHPACVSPVLTSFGISINDSLPAAKRQQLIPLIPLLPGTRGDGRDDTRGYLALDWLLRAYAPAWLELAGLTAEAAALRDSPPIIGLASAHAIRPHVDSARSAARAAARAAARDAAGDAARAAAWATLQPTIAIFQSSFIDLYARMVTP